MKARVERKPQVTYIIRRDDFVNIHVTYCSVKLAILTQYRRVGSSLIYFGRVYTACDLGTSNKKFSITATVTANCRNNYVSRVCRLQFVPEGENKYFINKYFALKTFSSEF